MTLQNRVTPYGEIIATAARGSFMGNRGILHDSARQIVKRWAHQQWIICLLAFKERKRELMTPGNYTELFFFDEATALAAGHRPCGECQYARYREFKTLFEEVHGRKMKSADIDRILHRERLTWLNGHRTKQKRCYSAELAALPDGTFINYQDEPYLLWQERLLHWTPFGYDREMRLQSAETVSVLTPRTTVAILARGYQPTVNLSSG